MGGGCEHEELIGLVFYLFSDCYRVKDDCAVEGYGRRGRQDNVGAFWYTNKI